MVVSGKALSALLASDGVGGRWTLTADGEGVERMFRFKTFAKTWVCLLSAPIFVPLLLLLLVGYCCVAFFGGGGTGCCEMVSQWSFGCPPFSFVDKPHNKYTHRPNGI